MTTIKTTGLLAIALILLALTGCGSQDDPAAVTAADDYETMDLDKAFGGLTVSDEAADFGDADLAAMSAADIDADIDDALQDDPEVLAYEQAALGEAAPDSARPEITVLRLTWGQLAGLPEDLDDPADLLDWSGGLSVDRGLVVARRRILFEARDHLVRPRPDRQTLTWVSWTGRHYDGLLIEIIVPPASADDPAAAPNMFHLRTGPLQLDIPVAELAGLDRTADVDAAGNALRLEGFHLGDADVCPKGFLGGAWVADPRMLDDGTEVPGGWFKGRWLSLWGRPVGVLRGRYGVNEAGEKVFFGKAVNHEGRFLALIEGEWTPGGTAGQGEFHGRWYNAALSVEGVLGGGYLQVPGRPGGTFSGRYAGLCDEDGESID
ncbi:MAG TPA: hypothetical protein P5571_09290 [Candidatus Krumholzibacteria bacterium]|nr:hypothetical protein [Candidatus Krumholzibacteria bacterium]HRX51544.1 hypothetical protein [Candidatus Krumholzibacteria bacterium]